ncbi:MAG: 23S rRNA (adenine(2503)-C(2))-methyltransferase RlmN [Holosporaceae bacterium]|nr:23S rRNA (adenine(2503)-C(2))-methyltransferase RlmN [Holosporaceae bacterium]
MSSEGKGKYQRKIMMPSQELILGLSLEELKLKFLKNGFTSLDAKRVFPWIHMKLAKSFDVMSDVPKCVRETLPDFFSIVRPECKTKQKSLDGTQKVLLEFSDGECVETVFIPDEKRNTICISTQIGCIIGCKFCHTGTQKFSRNLTSSEIMSQMFFWKDIQNESNGSSITNIVFMGMGEPLLNSKNLFNALNLLLDEKIHNFSRNKITVSTSGIVNGSIEKLAKFGVKLAISLHASSDEKRAFLMPINKKYNISNVLNAARKYLYFSNVDYVTFEYLLLSGVNDSDNDAIELAYLLKNFGIQCKVNLILFNDWFGTEFRASSKGHTFLRILLSKGIRTIIRKSRGDDIFAACGQLKSERQ